MENRVVGILAALCISTALYSADNPYGRVVNSPYSDLNGKIAEIKGDSQELWGIKDIWMSPESFRLPVIAYYLKHNPPFNGKVYYGKVHEFGYCFHESWLQPVDKQTGKRETASEEEIVEGTNAQGTQFAGPKWFVNMMTQNKKDED